MTAITKIDLAILLWIQEHLRMPGLNTIVKGITHLGDGGVFWIGLAIILLFFAGTRKEGKIAILSLAIGALLTNVILKNALARVRPYDVCHALIPLIAKPRDYSFPSGHTCASFASAFVYLKLAPKKWGIAAICLATLIALSRLYVGVHYPTDVLGGLGIGLLSGFLALQLYEKRGEHCREV